MSLSPETKVFHSIGPKDIGLDPERKPAMNIGIVRTTNQTGEQIHIDCPVYGDETREVLKQRLGFAYSVLQDRLEEENKAVAWQNKRQQTIRSVIAADKKNAERLEQLFAKCAKDAKRHKWTEEKYKEERDKIRAEADKALLPNAFKGAWAQAELDAMEEIPLDEFAKTAGYEDWVVEEVRKETRI